MKCRWVRFWNVQFSKSVGRFLEHFDKFHKLDKEGKRRTVKARYHKARMWTEFWCEEFCCLMLGEHF